MITLMLADDHHVVRQGLRLMLEAERDFRLVGEAGNGLDAVDMVEKLKPDVLVLDLMMPGLNGMDAAKQIAQRSPGTRVLILSMHANEAYVLQALKNGASGYVLKDCSPADLCYAVREVASGRRYLSPPLSERAIQIYAEKSRETLLDSYDTLTDREREVLHLTAEGHTSAQIAGRLSISTRTVETHRNNLMRKLNFNSQAELIRYALRRGILTLDE